MTQKERVKQTEPPQAFQVPEPGKTDSAYTSFSYKEKGQQAEPSQGVLVIEPRQAITTDTSSSSNLEKKLNTKHQNRMFRINPTPLGNPEFFIIDVSVKYPRLWALKGANTNNVRRWYNFRVLASICTVAPNFREISGLLDWVVNKVQESWSHNPHLQRGEELEIKFITAASEDTANSIRYPSFHFMNLQRPDKRAFTYTKE
ncbi:hypothetical protein ACS0TY_025733 [Phlomoides rotata]